MQFSICTMITDLCVSDQGVYENFRQELEQNVSPAEVPEERSSAFSDEQSSVTLSSAYHTDPLLNVAAVQGTVRKAGRLAVKNFLVHKKNKKVELAPRRKWKSYWVSLKGVCVCVCCFTWHHKLVLQLPVKAFEREREDYVCCVVLCG